MRLLGILVVLVVAAALLWSLVGAGVHRFLSAGDEVAREIVARCEAVLANLAYVASLPEADSPLREPIVDVAGDLEARASQIEGTAEEMMRLGTSGLLREREEARLEVSLRAVERATNMLHELATRAVEHRSGEELEAGERIRRLQAALEEVDDDEGSDLPGD